MTDVRPMRAEDVPAAEVTSYAALREAGTRYGWRTPEPTEASVERRESWLRHVLRHDPDGAWVAEDEVGIVGVALALRRGPLWFLSLLTVAREAQRSGIGARLLTAAQSTASGAASSMICASSDPKALRRYALAGHDLLPVFTASGTVDRALLPATPRVRDGSWEADRDLVERVGVSQRGAAYGPDLDWCRERDLRLMVVDSGGEQGVALIGDAGRPMLVGATAPDVATDLLWAVLAESDGTVEFRPGTGAQQWALRVAVAARLSVRPAEALCLRNPLGPLAPYLPSGIFG